METKKLKKILKDFGDKVQFEYNLKNKKTKNIFWKIIIQSIFYRY